MLTKEQSEKMRDIVANVDPHIGPGEAIALAVKMMAFQTLIFDTMLSEIAGIERCLERLAGKDFV